MKLIRITPDRDCRSNGAAFLPELEGKVIMQARVTNVLSSGSESTGTVEITFTDGSVFTIEEEGQAGYMSFRFEQQEKHT